MSEQSQHYKLENNRIRDDYFSQIAAIDGIVTHAMNPDTAYVFDPSEPLISYEDSAYSSSLKLSQNLVGLIELGKGGEILGIVNAKYYDRHAKLLTRLSPDGVERATLIGLITAKPTFIGTKLYPEFSAEVSPIHASVSLDNRGRLAVADRGSARGTTVLTAEFEKQKRKNEKKVDRIRETMNTDVALSLNGLQLTLKHQEDSIPARHHLELWSAKSGLVLRMMNEKEMTGV